VELYKSKATVEEARSGLKMSNLFNSLGVSLEEHKALAKAVSKVKDPDFVKGAIKLIKLEAATGKSYADIMIEYQPLGKEIEERQQAVAGLKEQQEIQEQTLKELGLTREKKEAELSEFEKDAEKKKAELDAAVGKKLAEYWTGEIASKLDHAPDDMKARFAELFDLYATIRPDSSRDGYHFDLSANIPLEMEGDKPGAYDMVFSPSRGGLRG
jgi:hypothetical protein